MLATSRGFAILIVILSEVLADGVSRGGHTDERGTDGDRAHKNGAGEGRGTEKGSPPPSTFASSSSSTSQKELVVFRVRVFMSLLSVAESRRLKVID